MVQSIALEGIISCFVFHFHKDKLIFRFHELSHSHASMLIDLGANPLMIAERLGHEDVKMTMNTYSHLFKSHQKEIIEKLEKIKL